MTQVLNIYGNTKLLNYCKKNNIPYTEQKEWNGYGYTILSRNVTSKENIDRLLAFQEAEELKAVAKRQRAIKKAEKDFDAVLLAIYTVNKEAKRQRDIKYNLAGSIYEGGRGDSLAHYQMHSAKDSADYYYSLKDKGIRKILELKKYDKIEIHEVNGFDMAYIVNGKFGFHFDLSLLNQKGIEAEKVDTKIADWISSEKKVKGMSLKTAETILYNLTTK